MSYGRTSTPFEDAKNDEAPTLRFGHFSNGYVSYDGWFLGDEIRGVGICERYGYIQLQFRESGASEQSTSIDAADKERYIVAISCLSPTMAASRDFYQNDPIPGEKRKFETGTQALTDEIEAQRKFALDDATRGYDNSYEYSDEVKAKVKEINRYYDKLLAKKLKNFDNGERSDQSSDCTIM